LYLNLEYFFSGPVQVWKEEAREEEREKRDSEILALTKKGYTAADIEKHLLKRTRKATASRRSSQKIAHNPKQHRLPSG